MKTQILAARARVNVRASTREQMEQLREQLPNEVLYSLIHNLHMSDAVKFEQIRVTQTSPASIVVLRFNPASDASQDDSGLSEDALTDLGRFADLGRKRLSGFWSSLSAGEGGAAFTLTLGADA